MQQRWYFCEFIWLEAICNAGVGVSDSRRQGISTPPTPHADEMCSAAKLCSVKQEIMCTLFRKKKKKLMKMCLVLFFSLFDLSDGSKAARASIRSGLQSVHTQKSPKGYNIACCEQRVSDAHAQPWCHCCASSQGHTGQVGTTAGTTLIHLFCSPEQSSGYTRSYSYGHFWVWTGHPFSRETCSSLNF